MHYLENPQLRFSFLPATYIMWSNGQGIDFDINTFADPILCFVLCLYWLLASPGHRQTQCWLCMCLFWEWTSHNDVIKWMHCPRYWPFVRGIHRSTGNSPHKGQWRGALIFSLICAWLNGWTNNRDGGDLRRHRAPLDVIVVTYLLRIISTKWWEMQITIYFTSKQPSISRNIHILSVSCTFAMCCLNACAKK